MKDCEHYETLISAWQDSELDRSGQVEMLDHLVRCAGCRDFYLGARGLAGLVAAVGAPAAGERASGERPSPEVWQRIERAARGGEPIWRPGAKRWWRIPAPAWAGAAAAALAALLVILAIPPGTGESPIGKGESPTEKAGSPTARFGNPPGAGPAVAEIRVGGNPEGMDDRRFVEVTRMVLGADRRYRTAFYEIMKQVVQDTEDNQPSMDILPARGEAREGAETPDSHRGPS